MYLWDTPGLSRLSRTPSEPPPKGIWGTAGREHRGLRFEDARLDMKVFVLWWALDKIENLSALC